LHSQAAELDRRATVIASQATELEALRVQLGKATMLETPTGEAVDAYRNRALELHGLAEEAGIKQGGAR
jgi:hypothetical protein